MQKLIPILLAGLLLTGCGFHLQGKRPLPPALQQLSIQYNQPYEVVPPALLKYLQAEAERRGGRVMHAADAAGQLRIVQLDERHETLSVSPLTGKGIETLVSVAVEFEFHADGQVVIPGQRLAVFREIFYDQDEIVAREYELEETRAEMQQELARQIFLRLETQLASTAQ